MPTNAKFTKAVKELRVALMNAACLASTGIPETLRYGSEFYKMGPATHDNHSLKGVAEWLSEALEAFNAIQQSMGIPRRDTRFLSASTGVCDRCEQEIRERNEARLVATGQKDAPAEKPERKSRRPSPPKRSAQGSPRSRQTLA